MATDKSIFSLRFEPNKDLLPEEVAAFIASPKKAGALKLHSDDFARYNELQNSILAFDLNEHPGTPQELFQKKRFLGVLAHSNFVKPALKSAVEQYKYLVHTLTLLDPKKPLAFIKSAEEEMSRLDPNSKEEAARLARMQAMVDERKKTVEGFAARWTSLVEEMRRLAHYIGENLVKIEALCEASISALASEQVDGKKEAGLIEDIKTHFKERLKGALHQGTITKEQLEAAKEEADGLTKQTADLLHADLFTLSGLYEGVRDHVKKTVQELNGLLARLPAERAQLDEDKAVLSEIEQVLVSLIAAVPFEQKTEAIPGETEHDKILFEKRRAFLDHLFVLLRK